MDTQKAKGGKICYPSLSPRDFFKFLNSWLTFLLGVKKLEKAKKLHYYTSFYLILISLLNLVTYWNAIIL